MAYHSLDAFLAQEKKALSKGPIALILLEDSTEVDSTLRHHLDAGFRTVVAFGAPEISLAEDTAKDVIRVHIDMMAENALTTVVNSVIKASPGVWLYYCYNAEYLFYPFCEHRSVGEMASFVAEERRDSILTYVIDLYADNLSAYPNAVSLKDAHLDKSGYYALARYSKDPSEVERQMDFYGGLRWRFEEHVPFERRRIDRIGIFRSKPNLALRANHTFNDPEYNTFACPWHHSVTAAICSFRTAKALKHNPGSRSQISNFTWHNSAPFNWHSQQLLDLGLMEPGQWF